MKRRIVAFAEGEAKNLLEVDQSLNGILELSSSLEAKVAELELRIKTANCEFAKQSADLRHQLTECKSSLTISHDLRAAIEHDLAELAVEARQEKEKHAIEIEGARSLGGVCSDSHSIQGSHHR